MSDTAVLFIVFNRPENTARVLEAIRQAWLARKYIATDTPRAHISQLVQKKLSSLVKSVVRWIETVSFEKYH
jgi:hypothetical protein